MKGLQSLDRGVITRNAFQTETLPFAAMTEYGYFQSGGIRLYYAFDLLEGVERPPLIVLSHGSGRVNTESNARYALALIQRDFAVFRFDKRGAGEVGGYRSQSPAAKRLPSTRIVPGIEFQSPKPTIGPPGQSGRSGLWVTRSRAQ